MSISINGIISISDYLPYACTIIDNVEETRKKSNKKNASAAAATDAANVFGLSNIGHSADVLDMPVDPNEPTYCLCHQVSYGEMIGCDNPDVGFLFMDHSLQYFNHKKYISI